MEKRVYLRVSAPGRRRSVRQILTSRPSSKKNAIADVAGSAGADVIITDNRRHFVSALRHGIRVETPTEFVAALKGKRP